MVRLFFDEPLSEELCELLADIFPGSLHIRLLGQGGAAVLNESGGLVWAPSTERTEDVYVHLTDKQALQQRTEGLLIEK